MSALPLLVVRPEPGNAATVEAARALGLDARAAPLFEIAPLAWGVPDGADFDGILAGSANVFRHGGAELNALRGLPVHVVGAITAEAAIAEGFTVATIGEGGLQAVLDTLPGQRLLRLAGAERIVLDPPQGTHIETREVYAARPLALDDRAADLLRTGAVAALHSGEAARRFAAECERLALPRRRIALACLAPRIAELAGEGWAACSVAAERRDSALLALAAAMCENGSFGGLG